MDFDYVDYELLSEIYELEADNFAIVKEEIKRQHYYNLTGNEEILTEGFVDIMNKMSDGIKKLIQYIKDFFRKFLMLVDSCFMEIDKFVKKYDKELNVLTGLDFKVEGFNFTLHDAPDMSEFEDIVANYNAEISDISGLNASDIIKKQKEYITEEHINELRGKILGNKEKIVQDDFHETVRRYYRDGQLEPISISVDDNYFKGLLSDIPNIEKQKNEAIKTRDKLLVLLDKTQTFFSKKATVVYNSKVRSVGTRTLDVKDNELTVSKDTYQSGTEVNIKNLESFLSYKYTQVNKIAGIINLVASERANAYKDQIKMARSIIKGALSHGKSDKGEEK